MVMDYSTENLLILLVREQILFARHSYSVG